MTVTKKRSLIAAAVAIPVLGALLAAGSLGARAAGQECTAYFGGMDISRRNVPVLTIFNAQETLEQLDIDIVLRDDEGNILFSRTDVVTLGAFQSSSVDLYQELIADLPRRTRPYQGVCALEVNSSSPTFAEREVILHVTEFFGNPKRARGAILFRPTWHVTEAP